MRDRCASEFQRRHDGLVEALQLLVSLGPPEALAARRCVCPSTCGSFSQEAPLDDRRDDELRRHSVEAAMIHVRKRGHGLAGFLGRQG